MDRSNRSPVIFICLICLLGFGCNFAQGLFPPPSPTPTETPLPTFTPTLRPTSTTTPTLTPSPIPTASPTPSPTATEIGGEQSAATTLLDNGWTLFTYPQGPFSIALPPTWEALDFNPEAVGDALSTFGALNPELGEIYSSEALGFLLGSGLVFFGIDSSTPLDLTSMPATLNILRIDVGISFPLDTIVELNANQLESLADPDSPFTHERVMLGEVEAEKFDYIVELNTMTGENRKVNYIQFLLTDGSTQYVLTFTLPLDSAGDYSSLVDDISQSFAVLSP